jgi:hypothetical protein
LARNLVLALVAATLFAATLTGCAQAPKPTHPEPPPTVTATVVAAPTDAAAAKSLVDQRRTALEQAPSLAGWAILDEFKVKPPATLADAALATAKTTGRSLWLPAPAVVGTPDVAVDYSRATSGSGRRSGLAARYSAKGFMFLLVPVAQDPTGGLRAPSTDASYGATIARYTPGSSTARWTRITVRGNPGVAFTRGSPTESSKPLRGAPEPEPSFVEWTEDGVRYQLMSFQLDPDQLLAIAGTMAPVKP